MNESVEDLIMEMEAIKKTQPEGILETEHQEKRPGTTGTNTINRIPEMKERI